MAISRDNYSADMWRRDGSSLIKGEGKAAVRYDLKMRQTNSLIIDEAILDLVLNTLNDPKTTDVTKNNINNLLTGKVSKAYVGAFELEKAPQQDVKTSEVFTEVIKKKSPPPVPKRPSVRTPKVPPIPPRRIAPAETSKVTTQTTPKAFPEPFIRSERVGSWVFIFANNKLDNPLTVEYKGRSAGARLKTLDLDSFTNRLNTLLRKTPESRTKDEQNVVAALRQIVKNKTADVTVNKDIYTLTLTPLDDTNKKKYEEVLKKREAQIQKEKNTPSPPPLPKLPPEVAPPTRGTRL